MSALVAVFSGVFTDMLRLLMWWAVLWVLWGTAERLWPLHRHAQRRPQWHADVAYYLLSGFAPKWLLAVPLSVLASVAHRLLPSEYYQHMAELPLGLRLVLSLVVADIGAYWGHRWVHTVPWLWRFHAIHHSAVHMDWLVNTRAHPLDMSFIRLCGLVPLYLLGLSQPTGEQFDWLPLVVTLLGTTWGFFIHANVRWRFGPLEHWLSSPAFHHWHHHRSWVQGQEQAQEATAVNYAALFPWIDRLFGTLHLPRHAWPEAYGIDEPMPERWVEQLIHPLRTQAPSDELPRQARSSPL